MKKKLTLVLFLLVVAVATNIIVVAYQVNPKNLVKTLNSNSINYSFKSSKIEYGLRTNIFIKDLKIESKSKVIKFGSINLSIPLKELLLQSSPLKINATNILFKTKSDSLKTLSKSLKVNNSIRFFDKVMIKSKNVVWVDINKNRKSITDLDIFFDKKSNELKYKLKLSSKKYLEADYSFDGTMKWSDFILNQVIKTKQNINLTTYFFKKTKRTFNFESSLALRGDKTGSLSLKSISGPIMKGEVIFYENYNVLNIEKLEGVIGEYVNYKTLTDKKFSFQGSMKLKEGVFSEEDLMLKITSSNLNLETELKNSSFNAKLEFKEKNKRASFNITNVIDLNKKLDFKELKPFRGKLELFNYSLEDLSKTKKQFNLRIPFHLTTFVNQLQVGSSFYDGEGELIYNKYYAFKDFELVDHKNKSKIFFDLTKNKKYSSNWEFENVEVSILNKILEQGFPFSGYLNASLVSKGQQSLFESYYFKGDILNGEVKQDFLNKIATTTNKNSNFSFSQKFKIMSFDIHKNKKIWKIKDLKINGLKKLFSVKGKGRIQENSKSLLRLKFLGNSNKWFNQVKSFRNKKVINISLGGKGFKLSPKIINN